ncbi:GFA family protein [Cucumibacter marinus]|uniref:GFA family protein n=1 Tax=Cucumibacter marinus TaxID=1121252 RepID=UPI00040D1D1B|nr:GFA family protein [Cucumibacter marinus]
MDLSGHCHCGAVSYTVNGEPVRMAQCHCNACRRTTGTGHLVQAFFKRDDITITGETKTYESTADSGSKRTRHFCPNCGSRLFSENEKTPHLMGIAMGSFDQSDWFHPQVILYNAERPGWDVIDPDIDQHEGM